MLILRRKDHDSPAPISERGKDAGLKVETPHPAPDTYVPRLLLVDGQAKRNDELLQALRENGMEVNLTHSAQHALSLLQQKFCDALLLEIPAVDMPASQMVAVTRNRFPFLPIIVLADKSRMNDAIGALNAGALHLIPMPCQPRQAISALRKILVFTYDTIKPARLLPGLRQTLRFELPSSLDYVTGAANQLTEMFVRLGIISLEEINIKIAIVEALTNAMEHGHHFDASLRVKVEARVDEHLGEIKITDSGRGFNHRQLPDPTAPENLYKPRGRGIYMMYRLMDEVHFNRKGNSVRLIKYRRPFEPGIS
ncbi:MAG: ATP-binding protein [candidate division KSB1 bacterium]|nr:ATP-binding protein [candidate division KSB1 bacterium]MDZ7273001.1 ATP-binding protein [candidate division KSB1 bacterium]MDZ7285104.1 ATP-binding protein [candidate division KSB1 bacterium]MDZ7298136.1 ATP-binding protein [candidate division KSB1 bacterium]MDZ7308801.1 ATP-binding protein [candidate division KSB1 bacterium]